MTLVNTILGTNSRDLDWFFNGAGMSILFIIYWDFNYIESITRYDGTSVRFSLS